MPFKSQAQMQFCYRTHRFDCKKWLEHTDSVCCLPYKVGSHHRKRCIKPNERIIGPIMTGSKGGRYFEITEKATKPPYESCTVRVYLGRKKHF
jgi:hypothetical protein